MISVIIPTRNRADLLRETLNSIANQSMDASAYEVLVVDNQSTDHTPQVVSGFARLLPRLSYLYASEPGLHVGRHAGLHASSGDLLVFADDDILASSTWLESIESAFGEGEVAMVGGNNYPLFLERAPEWILSMWNRSRSDGYRAIPELSVIEFSGLPRNYTAGLVWGCNFAIRKQVLVDAGGFHPDGMPSGLIRFRGDGETFVSRYVEKKGMKCAYHPGASVYHKVTGSRMTYGYFRRRGFSQGVSDSFTLLREKRDVWPDGMIDAYGLVKRLWGRMRLFRESLRGDPGVYRARQESLFGYAEGFCYHQEVYRVDPEVRAWVHRASYLDGLAAEGALNVTVADDKI